MVVPVVGLAKSWHVETKDWLPNICIVNSVQHIFASRYAGESFLAHRTEMGTEGWLKKDRLKISFNATSVARMKDAQKISALVFMIVL